MKQLDEPMALLLDQLTEYSAPSIETLTPGEARNVPLLDYASRDFVAKHTGTRLLSLASPSPEPVGSVTHESFEAANGECLVMRVYTPASGDAPYPVILYFHGGGFVIADINVYDASCRALCNAANAVVVSVAYRLAPENPFPAAVEDAFAAYQWLLLNSRSISGDPVRIAVAGESAGGNLAAVVCLLAKERGIQMPVHQLLIYPWVDLSKDSPSYVENAQAQPLHTPMLPWFKKYYLKNVADAQNWMASPLLAASHAGLPPATVITAENDPLRDEGRYYAEALKSAGVPTEYHHFDGVSHEFFGTAGLVPKAKEAVKVAAAELQKSFTKGDR